MANCQTTLSGQERSYRIFVIIMLAGLFINAWSFIALFLFIMAGCLYEFAKILKKINGKRYFYYLPLALIYIVMPLLMMIDLGTKINISSEAPYINNDLYSPLLPCAIIFSIWINDTMAYLVGSFIGKHPLSSISPKKTWEGTIGGGILCIAVISLVGYFTHLYNVWTWIIISSICAVFGTLGDLLESKIKRLQVFRTVDLLCPDMVDFWTGLILFLLPLHLFGICGIFS